MQKWRVMINFKKLILKTVRVIIDDIIKIEDFDFVNILLMKNHVKTFWFMEIHTEV